MTEDSKGGKNKVDNYIKSLRGGYGTQHPELNFIRSFVNEQRNDGASEDDIFVQIATHIAERSLRSHTDETIKNNSTLYDCLEFMEAHGQWVSMGQVLQELTNRNERTLKRIIDSSCVKSLIETSMLNHVSMQRKILSLTSPDLEKVIDFLGTMDVEGDLNTPADET